MCHHHDRDTTCHSNGLPSLFAVDDSIQDGDIIRIIKNEARCFKVDAVLSQIAPVLGLVPIEFHVVTIL